MKSVPNLNSWYTLFLSRWNRGIEWPQLNSFFVNSALNHATFAPYFTKEFLIKTICRDPVLHLVLGVLIAYEVKKRNLDKYASDAFFFFKKSSRHLFCSMVGSARMEGYMIQSQIIPIFLASFIKNDFNSDRWPLDFNDSGNYVLILTRSPCRRKFAVEQQTLSRSNPTSGDNKPNNDRRTERRPVRFNQLVGGSIVRTLSRRARPLCSSVFFIYCLPLFAGRPPAEHPSRLSACYCACGLCNLLSPGAGWVEWTNSRELGWTLGLRSPPWIKSITK